MAYSASLGVLLADQGSLSGTWGTALNNQVFALLDSAIAGRVVIGGSDEWDAGASITYTLSVTQGAANQARAAIIHLQTNNSKPAAAVNIVVPDVSKAYIINNSLGLVANIAQISTSGASDANSVFIPAGAVAEVYCDGAGKVTSAQNFIVGGVIEDTTIGLTTPSTGAFTTVTTSGTLVAGTTLTATGGIIASAIGATTPSTGAFTTVTTTGTLVAGTTLTATGGIIASAIGATTPSTGAFTTVTTTGTLVAGTTLTATGGIIASAIGATTPSTGAFTTVTTTGTLVAGTTLTATGGIIASAIGATTPSTGKFTTLEATTSLLSEGAGANSFRAGPDAGAFNQGASAVAIGYEAGKGNATDSTKGQGASAVAIGVSAGESAQGAYSIALGYQAGTADQTANSIVISSKGSGVNTAYAGQVLVESSTNQLLGVFGNWTHTGTMASSSDIRLKKDIEPITGALDKVQALNGVTFEYLDDNITDRATGLIAQDVQAVLPEAVIENANGHLAVGYGNMVGLLVEAIKELTQANQELTARVETLEG
jgi:hypothetical protein